MGRISTAICFILALLTVLSIAPPFLLAWACEFSSGCIVHGFRHFMIGPAGPRTQALVMVLVPIITLFTYVAVLLGCQKHKDVLDRSGRRFD
jgi:hypothetical protein